MPLQLPPPVH